MRSPENVLKSLSEKAKNKEYRYERLYRNLYNPEFYLLAYQNIATSQGSMTAGADGFTLDGMSMERIEKLIQKLRDHSYQPNPARRVYIAKKNSSKKRPLGIPSTDDKLLQEVVRMILEAIYEPTFSDNSHGFRPKRSCHTALKEIVTLFTGAKWIIEGDIKACFDSFDHHITIQLYTMQRYLQYGTLVEKNLQHFDAWASTFGETVTALEIAPEGNGYRLKTRFARFYNLPELLQMFREVADIQTADMLNLPVPEAEYRVVKVEATDLQRDMVEELGNRAEKVRNHQVNPREDNMLKITNDGRKLALDQRLANPLLPDDPGSKTNACVEEIYRHWEEGTDKKLTQLVFCDQSTPKTDGTFSVYNDIRDKLIARGIPPEEIAFIHDANTDVRKKELFSKVRRGAVRILMGSTFKMGAGTNVQDRIIASHDLDCPWRPRDLEQRAGRTIRQGNQNPKVEIIRYVTEGTFDAYLYQNIENKQKYISQIMTSKNPARSVEDIDEVALSYAEIKALATGNPYIKEKMELDIQVSRLQLLKQSFLNQKYEMEDQVAKHLPARIREQETWIAQYEADIAQVKAHTPPDRETFPVMQIGAHSYTEKKEAGQAIIDACKAMKSPEPVPLGDYRGLSMELSYSSASKEFVIALHGKGTYKVPLGTDIHGNITRLDNKLNELPDNLSRCREVLETVKSQLENARVEARKEFPQEKELAEKVARLGELNALLDMDKKDHIVMEEEPEEEEIEPEREKAVWVR